MKANEKEPTRKDHNLFIHKYKPVTIDAFKLCYATTDCTTDASMQNNFQVYDVLQTLMANDQMVVMIVGKEGSGKTTLVHAIINEYIHKYRYSLDNILFLNTLRDQGVQYYRSDVKNFCQTASKTQRKVVVFDDLDLLSEQSQQVFRTCVDKYHHSCHYVVTATNMHKLIENIQSLFLTVTVEPLHRPQMKFLMNTIVSTENLRIHPSAEEKMLDLSTQTTPNIKLMMSFLEKCKLMCHGHSADDDSDDSLSRIQIDLAMINQLCSVISFDHYTVYIKALQGGFLHEAIRLIMNIHADGFSVMDVLDNLFSYIKHLPSMQQPDLPYLTESDKYQMTRLICKYISLFHNLHEDEIELTLLTNNLFQYFHKTSLSCVTTT